MQCQFTMKSAEVRSMITEKPPVPYSEDTGPHDIA